MYQLLDPQEITKRGYSSLERLGARQRRAWAWLSEVDRLIVELAAEGNSQRLISRAVGVTPGTVSRRLTAIQQRLGDPVTNILLDPLTPLTNDVRAIALMHQVGRLPPRNIARQLDVTSAYVKQQLRYARGIARGCLSKRAGD